MLLRIPLQMNIIDLFMKILSVKSVTPDDGGLMEFIESYMSDYEAIYVNEGAVSNLFLTKNFNDTESSRGEHLCFAGHVDVVPAGDGWDSSPYEPMIKEGKIYARGAQDMKSGVAAFVQAVKHSKSFDGRLSILLTSDEEGDGTYGTQIMLAHLKEIDLLPDFVVVAEPTCEEKFGDAIKIGRRGSINGYLTVHGKQGHAAYPEKAINPVHEIAPVLEKIAGVDLDNGDDDFAPSQMVITDIRGGMQVTNVTPNSLDIMFNVRNSTKTTQDEVTAHIAEALGSIDYSLRLEQGSYPFVTKRDSKIVQHISKSISRVTRVEAKLSTAGGTSDARFMGAYGIDVVEFGVVNDTIHAPNECTGIDEVEGLYEVFRDLIENY